MAFTFVDGGYNFNDTEDYASQLLNWSRRTDNLLVWGPLGDTSVPIRTTDRRNYTMHTAYPIVNGVEYAEFAMTGSGENDARRKSAQKAIEKIRENSRSA